MKLNLYLGFNGNCRQAFEFYKTVLGGDITMVMTYGESPMADHMASEDKDKIMHIRLINGDNVLMGGDAPSGHGGQQQGFSVSIQLDNVAEGKRIFDALAENGSVQMPYDKTFWSAGFGMATDQFGTPWMVNCDAAS